MGRYTLVLAGLIGLIGCSDQSNVLSSDGALIGVVERVWEDGFQLRSANEEIIKVDAWEVCGDTTWQHVSVGDQLTLTGEFSLAEFDAATVTNANGEDVCR
jgi:hypothetical protein